MEGREASRVFGESREVLHTPDTQHPPPAPRTPRPATRTPHPKPHTLNPWHEIDVKGGSVYRQVF